jgi:transcriptional regulator with XRE-family HTH domain
MDVREHVGSAIQRIRRERGLSQDELAHRAGIDQAYMSRIENGGVDLGLRLLVRLSNGLRVAPVDLLEGFADQGDIEEHRP